MTLEDNIVNNLRELWNHETESSVELPGCWHCVALELSEAIALGKILQDTSKYQQGFELREYIKSELRPLVPESWVEFNPPLPLLAVVTSVYSSVIQYRKDTGNRE